MKTLTSSPVRALGGLGALFVVVILAGCSPEGTGSIKIENPEAVRAKAEGAGVAKPKTAKQAKAVEVEEDAAKKHPKLR